jgi:hypothetical protein
MQIETKSFIPLYKELYQDVPKLEGGIRPFFVLAGSKYENTTQRCLFIGKSVNGWILEANEFDEELLFYGENRIANIPGQMSWVGNFAGENHNDQGEREYNTNRSAFWQLIKHICAKLYGEQDDWYNYVAWSNLYKLSPYYGNPGRDFRSAQLGTCVKILREEINILQPMHVVFLTSGWEQDFLVGLGLSQDIWCQKPWGNRPYTIHWQISNDISYIRSVHPQGKTITEHAEKISDIILQPPTVIEKQVPL